MAYNSISSYIEYINSNGIETNRIERGAVYSYVYRFSTDYPIDELKFYDTMPLTYITDVNIAKKMFLGFNLHHMPVKERMLWYSFINVILKVESFIKAKKNINRSTWLDYQKIKLLMKRSTKAVRQYHFKRTFKIKRIPYEKLKETLKFYSSTYYGVTIEQINQKYFNN